MGWCISLNFNYYIHFEITGDLCNLIGSQQCDLFTNHTFLALNHICSKSLYFCSILRHFCFEYKMRCKGLFVSSFQLTTFLINKISVLTEFCDFKMAVNKVVIELYVLQFWSEIILVISNRIRGACLCNFEITRMISDHIAVHSVPLPLYTYTHTLKVIKLSLFLSTFRNMCL